MKRPVIKDANLRKYVDYLEEKLAAFDAKSIELDAYFSLKHTIEQINNVLSTFKINADTVSDKDDKITERALKFADNLPTYVEKLKKMYKEIGPELIEEKEQETGSSYEEAMKNFIK